MIIQEQILTKLLEFKENPRNLDDSFKNEIYKKILTLFAKNQLDIKTTFNDITKDINLVKDKEIINCVKNISMIKLDYVNSYSAYNSKTFKIKNSLIIFLAKYLIKRRATYLFIYMILQKKNAELLEILDTISNQYNFILNISQSTNIRLILEKLNEELQNKIKPVNKNLAYNIQIIFDNTLKVVNQNKIDYKTAFANLGKLIVLLNSKAEDYKTLVTDVIPLMAEWNDTTSENIKLL